MKIFKGKKKFVWSEPWFFCQRIRDRSDWLKAIIPSILAAIAISVLVFFSLGPKATWYVIAACALAAAAVVQLAIEAAYMRRDVTIFEDDLEAFGNAGQITSYYEVPIAQLVAVEIKRSEEINFPFHMLVVRAATHGNVIGIPKSIRLERIAQHLADKGAAVSLSGWTHSTDPDLGTNPYLYASEEGARIEVAKIEAIPQKDQNLTQAPEMILALAIAAWPFVLWLGAVIFEGYLLYQYYKVVGIWGVGVGVILGFASLVIPFGYYEMFGDYWCACLLIAAGRRRVQLRPDSLIKSFDERNVSVELVLRETWDKIAPKVIDFGFVHVDPDRRRVLYEGNKERWILPFGSIRFCKVEEVQYGAGGDNPVGELRCYVVLIFQKESGPYEIGLRVADKDIGKNTDTRRMRKAVELFEYLTSGINGK